MYIFDFDLPIFADSGVSRFRFQRTDDDDDGVILVKHPNHSCK